MFDVDRFIEDCKSAIAEGEGQKAVREVMRRAVSAPGEIIEALGEPREAGINTLYQSDDLTIINVLWAPLMTIRPHNHNMWANIGMYTGRDDLPIIRTESSDNRSYHINSEKIASVLGYRPRRGIEDAVRDLCRGFRAGKLPDSMSNDWYYNVRYLKAQNAA